MSRITTPHSFLRNNIGPVLVSFLSIFITSQAHASSECYQAFDDKNYADARETCQSIAELGDAKAAFLLATIYYQGLEVPVNEQRALFWDEIAADKGHPEAAYRLALAYQLGQGVAKSNSQARRWYMQAALARHPKAQKQLGAMYETGIAGEVNLEKAFEWYLKAARQGLPDAQLRAGTMLLEGSGTGKDKAHAMHWIRKAAEAGNANAQVAYGVMLAKIDPVESIHWYEQSAGQANGLALQNLASMYYTGEGVEQNHALALKLAQQAVAVGNLSAKPLVSRIQLDEQQQRVADLQAEQERLAVQLNKVPATYTDDEPAIEVVALDTMPETSAGNPASETGIDQQSESVSGRALGSAALDTPFMLADGWIMDQPRGAFTIQLTNGPDEKGVHKYIKKNQLPEGVRYYRTRRDAGVFYVLIYGQYPSVVSAQEALKQLPEAAQRDHWIRNISTLQKLYRQP